MTATRIGVSDAEFWTMIPGEFERRVKVFIERQKQEADRDKARFYDMLNAFGVVHVGKKWKWQLPPNEIEPVENFEERAARVLARLAERRQQRAVA